MPLTIALIIVGAPGAFFAFRIARSLRRVPRGYAGREEDVAALRDWELPSPDRHDIYGGGGR